MSEDVEPVRGLIQATGLRLTDVEMSELVTLYTRFAPDRKRLTEVDLGDVEPAIVFLPALPHGKEEPRGDR